MMPTRTQAPVRAQPAAQVNDLLPLSDWGRHHTLRSWPVMLFLLLICVPSIALLVLGPSPSASTFDHVAWIYAAYFAVAWLLLLGVIIRPDHVSRPMLVLVTSIALATQVPLAITLEVDLHADTAGLGTTRPRPPGSSPARPGRRPERPARGARPSTALRVARSDSWPADYALPGLSRLADYGLLRLVPAPRCEPRATGRPLWQAPARADDLPSRWLARRVMWPRAARRNLGERSEGG